MANNQMIASECPTLCKKARLDCPQVVESRLTPDEHESNGERSDHNYILEAFVSSSSDAEIMSCSDSGFDSGFQEFISNIRNKDMDSVNYESSCHTNNSNKYTNSLFITTTSEESVNKTHKSITGTEPLEVGNSCLTQQNTEYECDDGASDVSDLSCVSCLSDMSGQQWKPISGPVAWVHKQMVSGTDPRIILTEMVADNTLIPEGLDNLTLWRIIVNMLSEPPPRKKIANVNTLDDCVRLIQKCNRILVLTGAGVSVSCGIPDFRSRDGIYARLSKDFPDLPDPQAMFDIHYFRRDPRPFFKFAKEIYPGQFEPSISHKFIRILEEKNKLLRNYTQNIDTLEQTAGIERVITCHGSFATATCTRCKLKVDKEFIKKDIFEQKIPKCPQCPQDIDEMAVIKPDIVFFGEGLSDEFHSAMSRDKDECDLLIVMGSSLKVRPVALIPSSIPETVPQILINREPLNHLTFDVELLGDCDVIVRQLCERLGTEWVDFCQASNSSDKINESNKVEIKKSEEFCLEVNNNSTSVNSSLPFAFNSTVNELRVSDHNSCHLNDKTNANTDPLISDSTESETPKPSEDRIASQLTDDNYLYFPPSRYIFKGAEVFDSDLTSNLNNSLNGEEISEDSNSSLSASSLSTTPCSSSSSSLSTTDSLLSPVNSNTCNTSVETFVESNSLKTKTSSSYPINETNFLTPSESQISKT